MPYKLAGIIDSRRSFSDRLEMAAAAYKLPLMEADPFYGRSLLQKVQAMPEDGQVALLKSHKYRQCLWLLATQYDGETLDLECLHAALNCLTQGLL